jgi:hypothetical protein
MKYCCKSWHLRNLVVMELRLNKLAESIVSLHTRLLRLSTNFRPFLLCKLRSFGVVANVREDPFPLLRNLMLKGVHLRQLATKTYQITLS